MSDMTQAEVDVQSLMYEAAGELGMRFGLDYWRDCDERHAFPDEFVAALASGGWLGITTPEQYGGSGLGMREAAVIIERLASGGGGSTVGQFVMVALMPAASILRYGSTAQRETLLPRIVDRSFFFGIALTEPDAGSNALATATRAEKVDGGYRVNGQKIYISAMEQATHLQTLVRTTPSDKAGGRTDGLTLMIIDTKSSGVEFSPMEKLGTLCMSTSMLFLDDVFVPDEMVIGEVDSGWRHILDVLNVERISTTAAAVGTGELALKMAADYATNRAVFGRPIGSNQAIAFPLAHAKARLAAARQLNLEAASLFDSELACAAEGNMAKLVGTEACFDACDHALQTFGGAGYMKEQHIERIWRDARLWKIAPVSSEMVLSFVAQHVLGLPRSF
jgi:acyl-CoA dehydrogenase